MAGIISIVLIVVATLTTLALGLTLSALLGRSVGELADAARRIGAGELAVEVRSSSLDEIGRLAMSIEEMRGNLVAAQHDMRSSAWLKEGLAELGERVRGELTPAEVAGRAITSISEHIKAPVGALYLWDGEKQEVLELASTYAYERRQGLANRFRPGEGLVGQAAREARPIVMENVPEDYVHVRSGLGAAVPTEIHVHPLLHEGLNKGVLEVGVLLGLSAVAREYLAASAVVVASALESADRRRALALALSEAQQLAEEMEVQQEELRSANEELEAHAAQLRESESKLQGQQEEMEVVNEELSEKNRILERRTAEVERAQNLLAERAEELALASKYKSEFLANMSHELRTPLNSLLLLARSFADNSDGNLSREQVEAATVIYQSGNDLLGLINEILDLARIEAGRIETHRGKVHVSEILASLQASFAHMAADKGLAFQTAAEEGAPEIITTDRKRLEQVLRNLVGNAIKFTQTGQVDVRVSGCKSRFEGSDQVVNAFKIAVKDTGIGIPRDKQKVVFEAFQQADGGTSRRYGGTGLGLSISRQLVQLLGGVITLESEVGQGSTFTVVFPVEPEFEEAQGGAGQARSEMGGRRAVLPPVESHPGPACSIDVPDDRDDLQPGDRVLLIVEDDVRFARLLLAHCRGWGFKCLVATDGQAGLTRAQEVLPHGIILDLQLPVMDGWRVLELLKENPSTRHIPVHIMSVEEPTDEAVRKGAVGFVRKPASAEDIDAVLRRIDDVHSNRAKQVLVVEDDANTRAGIRALIGDEKVIVSEADSIESAMKMLGESHFDCIVLDLGLGDADGRQLLRDLAGLTGVAVPPVIVYTGRDLTRAEADDLRAFSDSIIVKDVRSEERLFDEVSLFLHRVVAEMPAAKRQVITNLHKSETILQGKKVLLVDDDMRTVYAMSRLLTDMGLDVQRAENGRKALDILEQGVSVDVVLMDIMMPVMDGYEAMQSIRADSRWSDLPIIALTAKAMQTDKERCLAAGASDYLPKPVDRDRLLSTLRIWLHR